jgi:outer membrane protein
MDLEKKISDYRNQKFGPNGELFQKQNEIMKPVQDKVFNAIQKVAADNGYDYILDKSGDALLLFSNDKYDLTDKVLAALKAPPSK